MLSRSITYLLIALLLPIATIGQDSAPNTYSLKEVQEQALKNNALMKLAGMDEIIARKTVSSFAAIGMPQIGGTGSFNHFIDIPTSVVPADAFGPPSSGNSDEIIELQFGSKYTSSVGVVLNQLIFDGTYLVGLKAAKTFVQVQTQGKAKTEIEVKSLVTESYYTVLIAQENANILGKNLVAMKKTLSDSKELFAKGFIESEALDQIKLLTSNLEISHNTAKEQVKISKKLLLFQMGLKLDSNVELSEDLESLASVSAEAIVEDKFAFENHIDYKLASTQVTLMELNRKKEHFTYLPSLGGFFNNNQNAFRNEFNFFGKGSWYPTTMWGLNLSVPIFGGFGKSADIKIASLELEKAQIRQTQTGEGLILKEQSARLTYASALSLYLNQKDNLALAEKIRNKTEIKFKEGLASSMELTQAENQFFTTQGAYIQSVFSLLNANTELQKALGKF